MRVVLLIVGIDLQVLFWEHRNPFFAAMSVAALMIFDHLRGK